MHKNTYWVAGLVVILVLGLAAWFLGTTTVSPAAPSAPEATTSSALPGAPTIQDAPVAAPAPAPSKGGVAPSITQTVWKNFANDVWEIKLAWETSWNVAAIPTKDGDLSQLSIGGKDANYFVSRNVPIAEPSKLSYTTTTRTVAGKAVSVHYYANPSASYAAYEYFSLPAGNATFYFEIQEKTAKPKEVEDFLSLVALK